MSVPAENVDNPLRSSLAKLCHDDDDEFGEKQKMLE